jgi:DUF1365 family protein
LAPSQFRMNGHNPISGKKRENGSISRLPLCAILGCLFWPLYLLYYLGARRRCAIIILIITNPIPNPT